MVINPQWLNRPRKHDSPEARLVKQCIIYLRARGHRAAKIKTHGVYDKATKGYRLDRLAWVGVPDILAFIPGLLFIECKATSGQSPAQKEFQALCDTAKIPYLIIRSLEELEQKFG